jgi:hypothetical protein
MRQTGRVFFSLFQFVACVNNNNLLTSAINSAIVHSKNRVIFSIWADDPLKLAIH